MASDLNALLAIFLLFLLTLGHPLLGVSVKLLIFALFLLFINDLNLTQCPIHSYVDDSTLHFSTPFSRRQNQKQVNDSCGDATERLISVLSKILD